MVGGVNKKEELKEELFNPKTGEKGPASYA